jgi:hypothetical protein
MKKRGARFWITIGAIAATGLAAGLDLIGAGMDAKEEFNESDRELDERSEEDED